MSQTPLTDAYLASRCKGENKQSWVEFSKGFEDALREIAAVEPSPANTLAWRLVLIAREAIAPK